jgi:hypothetical protein
MKETKVGFYVGELQTQHTHSLSLSLSLSPYLCALGFQTGCNNCIPTKAGCPKNWIQELHTRKSEEEDEKRS